MRRPMSSESTTIDPPPTIPLAEPLIERDSWEKVRECLESGWVSSLGPAVEQLEQAIAVYVGAKYAVATCSGTAALHLALLVEGVRPDDEVLVSDLTFIAPANVVRYIGAWPRFVDAEPEYWQMDPEILGNFLRNDCTSKGGELSNRATGRRIGAVLPVHVLGHPVNLEEIRSVAHEFGLPVVEDATESLGASYSGLRVGSSADTACFSFNGNKIITAGGGGMMVTDDERKASKARYLASQAKDDSVEYIHRAVGFNYRLSGIQAALGCAQMDRLDQFVESKRKIAGEYVRNLSEIPGVAFMREASWAFSTYWLSTILIDEQVTRVGSRSMMMHLGSRGIQARPLWQSLHLSPAHQDRGQSPCPVSEQLHQQALCLPSSVGLTGEQQKRVVEAIHELLEVASESGA